MFNAGACCISSICVTHLKGEKNDTTYILDCQEIIGTGIDGGNRHLLYPDRSCATRQLILLRESTTIISTNTTDHHSRLMAIATPTDPGIRTEDLLTVRAIAKQTASAHLARDSRPVTLPT